MPRQCDKISTGNALTNDGPRIYKRCRATQCAQRASGLNKRSKCVIKRYFGPKSRSGPSVVACPARSGRADRGLPSGPPDGPDGTALADLYRRGGACWYNGGWNDNWVVGFAVALVLYGGLTMVSARRQPARHASYAGQQG